MLTSYSIQNIFSIIVGIFTLGAFFSLLSSLVKDKTLRVLLAHIPALFGSLLTILLALRVFGSGSPASFGVPSIFPLLHFSIYIDALSAFFLFLIGSIGFLASIYGVGYMKSHSSATNVGVFGALYHLFLLAMVLVVTADHALYFLLVWELMSLASYGMVVIDSQEETHTRAGFQYLLLMHIGTGFIALAFFIAYTRFGGFDFTLLREFGDSIQGGWRIAILLSALLGFGMKAGLIPLHVWLPEAHPAAPSHVSALMSGVMIKTALFMLLRFFFDYFPPSTPYWGSVLILIGAVSAFLAILYALAESDIKRILAFSSVEQMGILMIALGTATLFAGAKIVGLAVIALTGLLFHILNHTIFKTLLFFGAGSLQHATHTRDIESMGGLFKAMPYTGLFMLLGILSMAAFPPFSGFSSEWIIFQSLFAGTPAPFPFKVVFLLGILSLALASGLTALRFGGAFGAIFLARPRTPHAEHAHESPRLMTVPMAVLAGLCVVGGIFAPFVVSILRVISGTIGNGMLQGGYTITKDPVTQQVSATSIAVPTLPMITTVLQLMILLATVTFLVTIFTRKRQVKIGPTWDCGYPLQANNEITSYGISRTILVIFRGVLRPWKLKTLTAPQSPYFPHRMEITNGLFDPYTKYLYSPITKGILALGTVVKRIQNGNVNMYLLYIFLTIILLFLFTM